MSNSSTNLNALMTTKATPSVSVVNETKRKEYHFLGVLHIETEQGHWFIEKSENTLYLYDNSNGKCIDRQERDNDYSIYDSNQYNELINRNIQ